LRISAHLDTDIDKMLVCACGCGMGSDVWMFRPQLIAMFEHVRAVVGRAILVTSGYRCPKHNEAIGGVHRSQHTLGCALDIAPSGPMRYEDFATAVRRAVDTNDDFRSGGVGLYPAKGFCHIDIALGLPPLRRWQK